MSDPARPDDDLPPIDANTGDVADGDQIPPGLDPLPNPTPEGGE